MEGFNLGALAADWLKQGSEQASRTAEDWAAAAAGKVKELTGRETTADEVKTAAMIAGGAVAALAAGAALAALLGGGGGTGGSSGGGSSFGGSFEDQTSQFMAENGGTMTSYSDGTSSISY